jgi:uncharacterized membrane protein
MPPVPIANTSPPPSSRWLQLRNAFVTGLFLAAPVGVCALVINFLIKNVGDPASQVFFGWMEGGPAVSSLGKLVLSALSILIVAILVTVLGYASHYLFGRWLLRRMELLILRVPIMGQVYRTSKQIVDTFHSQQASGFDKVVMVEFPRTGLYSIGFVTKPVEGEVRTRLGEDFVNVFIPTTPLPTNGFLVICREQELIRLDISVTDAMKLIISGGVIVPPPGSSAAKLSRTPFAK